MKTSIKSIAVAIALTAVVAGPAAAMVSQSDLNRDIRFALGSGSQIRAVVNGNTVTLRGYFADAGDKNRALQAARKADGIDRVINHAFQNN